MKLWLDDMRDAPDDSWTVIRKVEPAIKFIARYGGEITDFSLDHDIENRPDDETFKPVAYFLGECFKNDFRFEDAHITIHSDNPVGAKELIAILEDYSLFATWTPYTSQADFAKKFGLDAS